MTAETKELFRRIKDIDEIGKGTKKPPETSRLSFVPIKSRASSGFWFLHEIGSGGVLADDMGLGKTVQALALLLAVKAEDAKVEGKRKPFKVLIASRPRAS